MESMIQHKVPVFKPGRNFFKSWNLNNKSIKDDQTEQSLISHERVDNAVDRVASLKKHAKKEDTREENN